MQSVMKSCLLFLTVIGWSNRNVKSATSVVVSIHVFHDASKTVSLMLCVADREDKSTEE